MRHPEEPGDEGSRRGLRVVGLWLALGWLGFAALPWNAIGGPGFTAFQWLATWPLDVRTAPAAVQLFKHGRLWFMPLAVALALPLLVFRTRMQDRTASRVLIGSGLLGLVTLIAIAFAIDITGWTWRPLAEIFGELPRRQPGLGYGALAVAAAALMALCHGLALRGWAKGDAFVAGAIGASIALVGLFTLYPISRLFLRVLLDRDGNVSLAALQARFAGSRIWERGGVVWNTLQLGLMTAVAATVLALCFALIVARTELPARRFVRVLSVLPMITPPFVVGLALIMLFGRAGAVNAVLEHAFGIVPTRWIYGLPGVWLAQTLALTPVAYLVLVGVVEGISPTLEEAAQTLRASRLRTFATVTLPLMAPGLANAFLIVFIESLADFGNPLLLGGNLEVLSVAIYFAIVGVQQDPGRAAALAIVLLALSLTLFVIQRRLLARRGFVTISGRSENANRLLLPRAVTGVALGLALPWAVLALIIYAMIFAGGFFEKWGLDRALTLRHYVTAFGVDVVNGSVLWTGGAWSSFFTSLTIAAVSAPLTAAFGLLIAYLLGRQQFAGKGAFEFLTMLPFALPGTVVGISYILAFNAPPIELAYTGIILVACFVFRDMTTSLRAGLASLTQIDPSLDEASATMRAGSFETLRRVVLPLMRPAIVAALVYSFISAMTSISAVIFLTSPRFDMATVNIVGRAEVGEYGYATAYASVLIVLMVLAVLLIRVLVGTRDLGQRQPAVAG
ncbi:MAG: iron ABC transporter permease [Betaproteobacteria bacterium]|nr:MAG: iron ABC transporter permease [Betaproteobacteria bacterium]